jgi:Esterase PHB depolymerase
MVMSLDVPPQSFVRKIARRAWLLLGLAGATFASGADSQPSDRVIFDSYSSLSSAHEILRRTASSMQATESERRAAAAGQDFRGQLVDLKSETFALRVPTFRPSGGYAVLVFVPPWPKARIPADWLRVLDREGVILVSADRSGNEESTFGRRVPLALLAAHNVARKYQVDGSKVFVGGFSGGSRVALRLALAYPDVFSGALLDAGSDPIGSADFPLPPGDLMQQVQARSRIVLVAGAMDSDIGDTDASTVLSLKRWCITQVERFTVPALAHEVMPGSALARAFKFIMASVSIDHPKLLACQARTDRKVATATARERPTAI